jgi:hypothetical protein
MSFYQRHTKDLPASTPGFKLDEDNIIYYRQQCVKMDADLRLLKSLAEVKAKLADPSKQDYLYTPEYLQRRLEKLQKQLAETETGIDWTHFSDKKQELDTINEESKNVFPQVMDKELGKDPAIHERMSYLNDRRKELEDQLLDIAAQSYQDLRANLPKIYFMIFEGVDMDTVLRCFDNMIKVLHNRVSVDAAAEDLMDFSQKKYNLPSSMYDPIRKSGKGKKSKRSGTK